ncbi:neuroligin-2 isoform X2 [Neocloeon triangulifer]|uniref:neuroligin-2 isoform X2 n=1 Tax=Neocloeon triangulifer TaxID=2078957 RepID=UPI00286ED3CD|nr:neuroligin-2 isoform X2 [Neocloeon triangulifer]
MSVRAAVLVLVVLQGLLGGAQESGRRPWDSQTPRSTYLDQQQQKDIYENSRRFGEYLDNKEQRNWGYPDRGYGHQQPGVANSDGYYFNTRLRGGVGAGGIGGNFYGNRYDDPLHSTPFPEPGILAGWRSDLQGRQRPDSINLVNDRDVYVTTPFGQIQGFKVHLYDNPDPHSYFRPGQSPVERVQGNCSVFLGIPYAQPPVREGRFKPPRAHKGWQLLQAVDFGPACPQPVKYTGATKGIRDVDEDCLYLNVYSPTTASGLAQPYPVMLYIHGGDFQKGASNLFPAHVMASFYEVVVVTINYRLGALGFLSTGDENSPGNYGILDQAMALRWVHENIEFFNGDRNLITLFGPGAGAASAGLLMVAPRTRGLVSRVIAQSGSALADWAIIEDVYRAQNTSRVFARLLGCSIESSWKIVSCLKQGRNFYELGNADFQPEVGTFPWGPVLDKSFKVPEDGWYDGWRERDWHMFQEMPEKSIIKGEFNRGLSYLGGITHDEAAYFIYNNDSLAPDFEVNEEFFNQKVREFVLKYNYTLNPEGVYDAIKYMYTYWPDPQNVTHIREQYINLLSDFLYRAPSDKMAKLLVQQKVPVFLYHLNTSVEALRTPYWRRVPHDTEYYFLTGAPFMDHEFFPKKLRLENVRWTDSDRNMSHFFMRAYTYFARYGHPSHEQILGLHFDMAKTGHLYYLNINTTYNSSIMLNYNQKECAFWTNYLPSVIGMLVPTYPPTTEFWWEPNEPLQIAFWSVSGTCLLLIVIVFICCVLWRNAKSPY